MAQDQTVQKLTQKEAAEFGRDECSSFWGGLNHLTTTRSGLINPSSGHGSLHSCLHSLWQRTARAQEDSHGSTCGRTAMLFGSKWGTLCGRLSSKFNLIIYQHTRRVINVDDPTSSIMNIFTKPFAIPPINT